MAEKIKNLCLVFNIRTIFERLIRLYSYIVIIILSFIKFIYLGHQAVRQQIAIDSGLKWTWTL